MRRVLLALSLLVFLHGFAVSRKTATVDPDDYHLNSWYRGYNETWFGNSLPNTVDVSWANLEKSTPPMMGETIDHFDGSFSIRIDRGWNPVQRVANFTLLHEMCHVYVHVNGSESFDSHGNQWQDCMMMLAKEGAFKDLW